MDFLLRPAVPDDLGEILRVMHVSRRALACQDWFVPDTEAYFASHIDSGEGFCYVAQAPAGELAAYFTVKLAGEAADALGRQLGMQGAELRACAQMDSCCVAPPYRGRSLEAVSYTHLDVYKRQLAVLGEPFALVLGQEGGGVRSQCQLVHKHHHLLGVGEGPLHKIKGGFQSIPGGRYGLFPAAHLGVETGPHRIKGFVVVHGGVQLLAPAPHQGGSPGVGGDLGGGQPARCLACFQLGFIVIALGRKHGGRVGDVPIQAALEGAQLLVAGIGGFVGLTGFGKTGVQSGQQQADQAHPLVKGGVEGAVQHRIKGLALQDILHPIIGAVFLIQSPVGGKIPGHFRMAQILPDDLLVRRQTQRPGRLQIGGQILPAAGGEDVYKRQTDDRSPKPGFPY